VLSWAGRSEAMKRMYNTTNSQIVVTTHKKVFHIPNYMNENSKVCTWTNSGPL
jgi:hypothetical protein